MINKAIGAALLSACLNVQAAPLSNRQVVLEFIHLAFTEKQLRPAFERYVAPSYIQHNPNAPDGTVAAIQFLEGFQQQFPDARYDVQRVASEDDLVFVHVHARTSADDPGIAVVDIFRLENGRIAEHWDVLQPVPEKSVSAHPLF
ncbi:nuclear transport factor 2 family protein [Pseudomonas sp. P1.8]|jgi:predicted SnoaL-like aldol condensation-catalyzing enzyme|uniref:nuclear transport factor 2 family protein n=1 Tax=Pseudomonas sp. P1.8 TaxID=1699310 RepID=UPI0009EC3F73|nr:nuclear transport factor 2 family protein [Pseudomonas sp. P1.8]